MEKQKTPLQCPRRPKPKLNAENDNSEDGYEGLTTLNADGQQTLSLMVGGVHCAVCIQKIESALAQEDDVKAARLNFSTGRLNIAWNGSAKRANDFAAKIKKLGYKVSPFNPEAEKNTAEQEGRFLLLCLGVAGFAMGNIMLLSVGLWVSDTESMGVSTRALMHWISALIAIPAIFFAGRPFFKSAYAALRQGGTNMDVPISLALILATGMSIYETIDHGEHVYFDSAVMLMFFLLIGRFLDFRARRNAKSAATDLMQTLSGFVTVLTDDGKHKRMLIRDVREGMKVLVAAGEKIPVDGRIIDGHSSIDTSLITGETLPRDAIKGTEVFAGTLNQDAPLTIEVEKAAEDSLLSDIVRLMEKAEQGQARYVRLADRAARLYTPVVHLLALAAFALWWGIWGAAWQDAILISVTVLIITCPCALGLAVPVVQVLATGQLMKRGILVKSGDALERLAAIDSVFFDKTGTLTLGQPQLTGDYEFENLQLAASLASNSAHPLAQALHKSFDGELLPLTDITEHAGKGLSGEYCEQVIKIGRRSFAAPDAVASESQLNSEICLSVDGILKCCFTFEDALKTDSKETVHKLQNKSLKLHLISGDLKPIVTSIAAQLGIANPHGEVTPIEKSELLEAEKSKGHKVLMVGDGLNDAPVLAGANVSMAPGSAVDMAQNVTDIVFMGDKLAPVNTAHNTAVLSQKLVKENFALAIAYNFIAVPLAFAGMVTPMVAAIAMSGSSLLVIANSYRLKLQKDK